MKGRGRGLGRYDGVRDSYEGKGVRIGCEGEGEGVKNRSRWGRSWKDWSDGVMGGG